MERHTVGRNAHNGDIHTKETYTERDIHTEWTYAWKGHTHERMYTWSDIRNDLDSERYTLSSAWICNLSMEY